MITSARSLFKHATLVNSSRFKTLCPITIFILYSRAFKTTRFFLNWLLKLLSKIQDAYHKDPDLKNLIFDDWFNNEIATRLDNLAKVVSLSTKAGIPVPCLSSTLDYLNSYRTNRLPQNLVQAMRDCFGSHTYERIDREGSFHTEWMKWLKRLKMDTP